MKQQTSKGNPQSIQSNFGGGQAAVGTPSSNANNCQTQKGQQNLQPLQQVQVQQVAGQQKFQDMKRIEDYTFCLSDLVGKGASGTVYLGENTVTKEMVAIKVIDLHQVKDEYTWGLICSEIDIMKKLKCENVVRLIDVFQTQNNAYIVTELCEDGDLVDFMKRNAGKIRQNQAVKIITDILRGLQELAKHGIIHRDLKPANILIAKKEIFKITDFGFARMVEKTDYLMTSLVGTPLYMSPQILKRQMYTSKCDVWSIGLIFYELIYGQTPWPSNSVIDLVNNMFSNPLKFPTNGQTGDVILEGVKDFIKGCLKFEEADRLGWDEVYKHILFKDALYASSQKNTNNNTSVGGGNFTLSSQDERGSQLKSPHHQRDSQNKKGSFTSSFQTSFMTSYTSAGTSSTTKTGKGNNNSTLQNNYSSKQSNLYSTQKHAKGGNTQQKQTQQTQQANNNNNNNTSNLNGQSSTSTNATNFNSTGNNAGANNNNNNTTLSTSSNSSNHNNNNNNNQNSTSQNSAVSANNNSQQISLTQQVFKQYSKQNSRQNTPSLQKQQLSQPAQTVGNTSAGATPISTQETKTNSQNTYENSQQSTPRQQQKVGNYTQSMIKQMTSAQSNGVIPQSGSFILNSPTTNNYQSPQPGSSTYQQQSSFNTYNRQSQISSPQIKDKKSGGLQLAGQFQGSSSFLQQYNQSQGSSNKLDNQRQQYKKQVKDKKSTDFQYAQGSSNNNLPSESQLNNNFNPMSNNSAVCYGSQNSGPSDKSNITAVGTAASSSSTSNSSFNFIHKRQKSARDVITNYTQAQNNFYIPLASPTKQQIQSDKYRILTEPNQMNDCKEQYSPNKNITVIGMNRESTLQHNQNNQNNQQQSSSSPLSTEPSQNPVPTVLITLGSMNQIPCGNLSTNNGQVNSPPKVDLSSGQMLNFSNDQSELESPNVSPLYPNSQYTHTQKVGCGLIYLESTNTPEKNIALHLKPGFYQQRGYSKNNARSITPTMSASAQKTTSPNTSNNTPKVHSEHNTNGQSNSKKALSNFNKFATYVYNSEERGSKLLPSNSNMTSSNSQIGSGSLGNNNKRNKFNNRLSQHQQQNQIQSMTASKLQEAKINLINNNIQHNTNFSNKNFDPFKTADQILTQNHGIQDESLTSSGSPKVHGQSEVQQISSLNSFSQVQGLNSNGMNKPQHNYIQLTLNTSNTTNSINHNNHFQSEKKVQTSSQSPTAKHQSGQGKQSFPSHQYKSYDFSSQISNPISGGSGITGLITTTLTNNSNNGQTNQFVPRNSTNQIPSPQPHVIQCRLDDTGSVNSDNKYQEQSCEKSPQHILNNPIINLNRGDGINQQKQQITQVNLNYPLSINTKQQTGVTTGSQSAASSFIGTPATNNSNVFSQLYNMEIGNQQINSTSNHVALNLCGIGGTTTATTTTTYYQSPIIDTSKSVVNVTGNTPSIIPIDLKKTQSDFFSPQIKSSKFSFEGNGIGVPTLQQQHSNTTTNQSNIQSFQSVIPQSYHNRSIQKSSDFASYQRNFISSFVQEESYSSVDILNNYLNFCKLLFNLMRIVNNSNFDKANFSQSNCLLEKVSFILLKNAMMKLSKVNEKMYANGDNIFNLSDWNTFKVSGKYTEIQTSFFLLFTEIQSTFEQEWNKGNNHTSQAQQLTSDYSFIQLFNKDMTDDVRFYSISLTFIKSFITLLHQKLQQSPLTSLSNPSPIFTDKNDIVVITLLDDFLEYHEILKTNLICMDSFHNQIFIKFNQFLSKFNNTYNYLTLVSKTYDSQFISNLQQKVRDFGL